MKKKTVQTIKIVAQTSKNAAQTTSTSFVFSKIILKFYLTIVTEKKFYGKHEL